MGCGLGGPSSRPGYVGGPQPSYGMNPNMGAYRVGPQYYQAGQLGYYGGFPGCQRCMGTGWNSRKNRPCKRCHKNWNKQHH